jgi:hypothetical protein
MNPFQAEYTHRLVEWKALRLTAKTLQLGNACVVIDKWWQQAPLVNHHLHYLDTENWPDPWTMLSENTYCTLTRAVGMCYTLLMCNIDDIKLNQCTDEFGNEYDLVMVNDAKYIMNYHPNTVLSNSFKDFKVVRELSLNTITKHIQ